MIDFLRASRQALRIAAVVSLGVLYFGLTSFENRYQAAEKELKALLSWNLARYENALRAAVETRPEVNDLTQLFHRSATTHHVPLIADFPRAIETFVRHKVTCPSWRDLSYVIRESPLSEELEAIRKAPADPATLVRCTPHKLEPVLDAFFAAIAIQEPTLVAFYFEETRASGWRLFVDVDVDHGLMPKAIEVGDPQRFVLEGETPHRGRIRCKYSTPIAVERTVFFPSAFTYMVDSLGVHTAYTAGDRPVFDSLWSILEEIGDMRPMDAVRYVAQAGEARKTKGSMLGVPFDYLQQSWLPSLLILFCLVYALANVQMAHRRIRSLAYEDHFAWAPLLEGRLERTITWGTLLLPVFAAVVALIRFRPRTLNVVLLLAIAASSWLLFRRFEAMRRMRASLARSREA